MHAWRHAEAWKRVEFSLHRLGNSGYRSLVEEAGGLLLVRPSRTIPENCDTRCRQPVRRARVVKLLEFRPE